MTLRNISMDELQWGFYADNYELDAMEEYSEFVLSKLKQEQRDIDRKYNERVKNMTPEEARDYGEWLAEDYWKVADTFTQIATGSLLVMVWAFFEVWLDRLGNDIRHHRNLNLRIKDMRGSGLKRVKLYYEKVLGIDLTEDNELWGELQAINKIRNSIVHNDGSPNRNMVDYDKWEEIWSDNNLGNDLDAKTAKKLKEALKDPVIKAHLKRELIEIGDFGPGPRKIVIKPGYIKHCISITKDFLTNLMQRIKPSLTT
ncbi:MAG: hypothetical protein KJ621_18575 [Proteobacteria bacterium]|nr:hypothetical protein [Pseudomonadota bacterium]